jgi:3-oxoadipate enol-lactonase
MDDLVDDAARLVREWGRGPVVFVGLSMGGMVGQGLAIRYPELVKGLVLANTTSQYPPAAQAMWSQRIAAVEQGGMAAIADMVVERYLHAGYRAAHPGAAAAVRAQVLRNDPAAYVATCHAVRGVDWLERLSTIRVPTLVIAGAQDVGATPEMAKAIADRIEGSKLVVFDDASHLSVAETPEKFEAAVSDFAKRL